MTAKTLRIIPSSDWSRYIPRRAAENAENLNLYLLCDLAALRGKTRE